MEKSKPLPLGSPISEEFALRVYKMFFEYAQTKSLAEMNPGLLERTFFLCALYYQIQRKSFMDSVRLSKRPEYEILRGSKNWLFLKILQLHSLIISQNESTEKLYFSVLNSGRFAELPTKYSHFWIRHANQIASLLSQNPKSIKNNEEFLRVFELSIKRIINEYALLGESD